MRAWYGMHDLNAGTELEIELLMTDPPRGYAVVEVATGVGWARIPLPFTVGHINVWAIRDGDGCVLVDTGAHTPEAEDLWRAVLDGPLQGQPIRRLIVTHMHPDHAGMAGWLTQQCRCELWMTRLEYLTCRVTASEFAAGAPQAGVSFFSDAGWSESEIGQYRARFGRLGQGMYRLPECYRRLGDGDELRIGAHSWRVVVGNGHSPEHACLHCPELRLLISGDQVLPRISSVVMVTPTEPHADPLGDWLASIEKIRRQVPDDVLVLPAHDEPFYGLHARLDALRERQVTRLRRLRELLTEPKRARDVFPALFRRPVTDGMLYMATGEAVACLNHLLALGEIRVSRDATGVHYHRSSGRA
jgi:glyoxylase-like metal-dependent hydrolase (beta-lactamase superfamily II)